jgi:hypothetical protein
MAPKRPKLGDPGSAPGGIRQLSGRGKVLTQNGKVLIAALAFFWRHVLAHISEASEDMWSELTQCYGGTVFALVPDDYDPEHLPAPETLVQQAFAAGADSVLRTLRKRAAEAFPAAIPALEAMMIDVKEVRTCPVSAWDLYLASGSCRTV